MLSQVNCLVENNPTILAKVVLTESPPPSFLIIPFKKDKIASISIKTNGINLFEDLINTKGFVGFFEVTEALPVAYDKNVVDERGIGNNESWDGIVEEHCKTKAELLNPTKFFGGVLKMIPNMISVYTDTKSFLDYGTIETYLNVEYHIKSSH